jgi:hypothetical protein
MTAMNNLLDPAVLFFVFGVLAGCLRSNLSLPEQTTRFLSLYLLMSVGLKGGFALARSGGGADVLTALGAAMALALLVPLLGWLLLRNWLPALDAAAVAATYGSVSATTFIAATQYLQQADVPYGGHMAVALVLMESPAVIMAVGLAAWVRSRQALVQQASAGAATGRQGGTAVLGWPGATVPAPAPASVPLADAPLRVGAVLRHALTDGAHLLLVGSLAIGFITGERGHAMMEPFSGALFKGMLALFLMDMGLTVARQWPSLRDVPHRMLAYAVVAPPIQAGLAIALARVLGMASGDATLLAVLAGSSSYIVVPAVLRHAIPEARPGLYLGMSLGLTFVFNILIGIPLYAGAVAWLWA